MPKLFFQKHTPDRLGAISLRAVLTVGFGLVLCLVAVIATFSLIQQRETSQQFSRLLDRDLRAAELGQRIVSEMASARRSEKDFVIFREEFGFAEAKSRYLTLLQSNLADARQDLADLDNLIAEPATSGEIHALQAAIAKYEIAVVAAVELQGKLGFIDTGIEGQFRAAAHEIESLLDARETILMADLLSIRRYEKAYLRRGRDVDRHATHDAVQKFKKDIGAQLGAEVRGQQLARIADIYWLQFGRYVETSREIVMQRRNYRTAVQTIEPALHALLSGTQTRTRSASTRILGDSRLTERLIFSVSLACIALGTFIAWLSSRRITSGLASVSAFAQQLGEGNYRENIPWVGKDEFSVLGQHLTGLANALRAAATQQRERTTELNGFNVSLQCEVQQRTAAEAALCKLNDELERRVEARTFDLAESEERFHRLANMSSDWYWQQDAEFRFTEMSSGMGKKSGVQGDAYIGRTRWEMPIELTAEQWAEHRAILEAHESFSELEFKTLFEHVGERWFSISGEPWYTQNGTFGGYRGVGRDITERKQIEHRIKHLSLHDGLTGLANRALLHDRLTRAMAYADRYAHEVSVGFLDLDAFKPINDLLGHRAGDTVLQVVAQRLQSSIRESDTVARLGGDEFVVVLPEDRERGEAAKFWARLMQSIASPIVIDGHSVTLGCSVGVASYPADGATAATLIENADSAMYSAKQCGRNNLKYYRDVKPAFGLSS